MRLSVGAVNVRTGNFAYFDTTKDRIRPEHIMASGALPPAFAAVEVDGEYSWDGGLVSNTPLRWVVDKYPQRDTLVFQVDLWSARGELPAQHDQRKYAAKGDHLFEPHSRYVDAFHRVRSVSAIRLPRCWRNCRRNWPNEPGMRRVAAFLGA